MLNITLEELLEAGSHFGHNVRRWNPKMARYIYAAHEGVHVFDLTKTREALLEACEVLEKSAKEGKTILLVGTKKQARDLVSETAKNLELPFVSTRWLGGLLTNFEQMRKSVRKLEDLKKGITQGDFDSYTKKERLLMDREIQKLEYVLGGVVKMSKLPDLIFVVDTHAEKTAVFEARKLGIPVIGICDTNSDPTLIDYPIPANDDAQKSLELIIKLAGRAIAQGLGKTVEDQVKSEKLKVKNSPKKSKEKVEESKSVT